MLIPASTRVVPAAAAALLASTCTLLTPAQAADAPPVLGTITTENAAGGLTPYVPLSTHMALTFSDATPSNHRFYRIVVSDIGSFEAAYDAGGTGEFKALIPTDGMQPGTTYDVTVEETDDAGNVMDTSATASWTYRIVKHARSFSTSSTLVRGVWSYRAGSVARFSFRGKWENGTRYSTQVWVSRTKRFTAKDYTANTTGHADLVTRHGASRPVLKVKIPARLRGKYVWVSVMGWKHGKAGWLFTVPAEKVIAPR
jgi:hypothetical protein